MQRTAIERGAISTALLRMIAGWIARMREEMRIRRAVDTLMTLDDRQLADIGLNRSHAEYVARHGRLPGWVEQIRH